MNFRFGVCGFFCFLAFSQTAGPAATFVLEPVADVRILGISGHESRNDANDILSVYTASGNVQRTLIRFDGISVQAGERVSSAVLSLVASTGFGGSNGRPMEVYRVTVPWTENGATWLGSDIGTPWGKPGGDYVGQSGLADIAPYASSRATPAQGQLVLWDIVDLVDEWIEGTAPNHGLLLKSYATNGLTFAQREGPNPAFRPKLTITIDPGPPRLRAELLAGGQVLVSWRGQNVGVLEQNDFPSASGWITSSAPAFVNGRSQVTVQASAARRFFRLRSP
jgi:hypothetical protein